MAVTYSNKNLSTKKSAFQCSPHCGGYIWVCNTSCRNIHYSITVMSWFNTAVSILVWTHLHGNHQIFTYAPNERGPASIPRIQKAHQLHYRLYLFVLCRLAILTVQSLTLFRIAVETLYSNGTSLCTLRRTNYCSVGSSLKTTRHIHSDINQCRLKYWLYVGEFWCITMTSLGVLHHRQVDCLFKRLCRQTSNWVSKPALLVLSDGIPPMIGDIPSQRANNVEIVFPSWRQHDRSSYDYHLHDNKLRVNDIKNHIRRTKLFFYKISATTSGNQLQK